MGTNFPLCVSIARMDRGTWEGKDTQNNTIIDGKLLGSDNQILLKLHLLTKQKRVIHPICNL